VRGLAALIAAALLQGCAMQGYWYKPEHDLMMFERTKWACVERYSAVVGPIGSTIFMRECLEQNGWTQLTRDEALAMGLDIGR
jgi:hypothetical protein